MNLNQTEITKDLANKRLLITRSFNASLDTVWRAWSEQTLLDQWWAPRPFRAETKRMDFVAGGTWHYCMVGSKGEHHWCRMDFIDVVPKVYFTGRDAFCDEAGNVSTDLPRTHWRTSFQELDGKTNVEVEVAFNNVDEIEKIIEMGFKEGLSAGHRNLDELLVRLEQ
ncbi:MAG: SRPBCC domain-containing protein [Cyclobacteriaceae bacterium]